MKLNTKYYDKKRSNSSSKKKKITKNKGPKLAKNYADMSDFSLDSADIPLTQLRYGMIESCNVKSIVIDNELITIHNSWIGLLLLMIGTLIERNPDDFTEQLGLYEVTNQFFCIDKIYGKYTFEGNKYKAYKIADTEYYLESTFESSYIFNAIVGLTRALDIELDKIVFKIINKNMADLSVNFNLLSETEEIVTMYGVKDKLHTGIHMVALDIKGEVTPAHRMDVVLYLFCNWVFNTYGYLTTIGLKRINNTGIGLDENPKGTNASPIINSDGALKVFTNNNTDDMVDFIVENMKKLNIDKDSIKLKFRSLKNKKDIKEWELE